MSLKEIKERNKTDLMSYPNVVGVGVSLKRVGGSVTEDECVCVFVKKKVPLEFLSEEDVIPTTIEGVLTDVIESGAFKALQERTDRIRPVVGGISVGHPNVTAGTLGMVASRPVDGSTAIEVLFISNNHVLADSNDAAIDDPLIQPGAFDGGEVLTDRIGFLQNFIPINFDGAGASGGLARTLANFLLTIINTLFGSDLRLCDDEEPGEVNLVDAAVGKFDDAFQASPEILDVGIPTGIAEASVNMAVKKSGRTTELTEGTVIATDVTARVNYNEGKIALFEDQIAADLEADGGDSGSIVLDDLNRVVGLGFAAGQGVFISNRIQNVFSLLDVELFPE